MEIKAIVMPLVVKQPKLKTLAILHMTKPKGHFPSLKNIGTCIGITTAEPMMSFIVRLQKHRKLCLIELNL